jgi:hypothetical protein
MGKKSVADDAKLHRQMLE